MSFSELSGQLAARRMSGQSCVLEPYQRTPVAPRLTPDQKCTSSDLLVRVEHHSKVSADGPRGEVLGEFGSHHTAVAVASNNLAPSALVVVTCL